MAELDAAVERAKRVQSAEDWLDIAVTTIYTLSVALDDLDDGEVASRLRQIADLLWRDGVFAALAKRHRNNALKGYAKREAPEGRRRKRDPIRKEVLAIVRTYTKDDSWILPRGKLKVVLADLKERGLSVSTPTLRKWIKEEKAKVTER